MSEANNVALGYYKTEKKAKEVIKEIIDAYMECSRESSAWHFGYVKNNVYEMPYEYFK